MAQSVKRLTLDFSLGPRSWCQGHEMSSASGFALSGESTWDSLPPSNPTPHAHTLSQIKFFLNLQKKNRKQKLPLASDLGHMPSVAAGKAGKVEEGTVVIGSSIRRTVSSRGFGVL